MTNADTWLREQVSRIERGEQVTVTVRDLLAQFGAAKRGRLICEEVDESLAGLDLVTWPDYRAVYIDGLVELKKESEIRGHSSDGLGDSTSSEAGKSQEAHDPVPRLAQLSSANREPVKVHRDARVSEAVTLMMMHDFSQLPVMQGDRDPDGFISWKTIGRVFARGSEPQLVREAMESCEPVPADLPLAEAIQLIVRHDFVLVKGAGRKITGLVTTFDISMQFHELARPFILISQIEGLLRKLLDDKFTTEELASVKNPADESRTVEQVADLTLGECVRLLQPDERWAKLGWGLDRRLFVQTLDDVRRIRNDIMHFDPDPIDPTDLKLLDDTARCLSELLA